MKKLILQWIDHLKASLKKKKKSLTKSFCIKGQRLKQHDNKIIMKKLILQWIDHLKASLKKKKKSLTKSFYIKGQHLKRNDNKTTMKKLILLESAHEFECEATD